jgi:hypothetical protein
VTLYQYIHELIFGALAVNVVLFFGIIKNGWKLYKVIDEKFEQHDVLWDDYCYREGLRKDRVHGNMLRREAKIKKEHQNGSADDTSA